MNKKYNVTTFVIIGVLAIFSILIIITIKGTEKYRDSEFKNLENNNYNTFTPITVNENEMPANYLYDYYKYLQSDIETAYSLLDENFKQTKFPTLDLFKEYVKNLKFNPTVDSYKVEVVNNNYVFHITAPPNVNFVFRTTGVMQYTVEIK